MQEWKLAAWILAAVVLPLKITQKSDELMLLVRGGQA